VSLHLTKEDVGKKFVCRDGKIRTVTGFDGFGAYPVQIDNGMYVSKSGYFWSSSGKHDCDLVCPWGAGIFTKVMEWAYNDFSRGEPTPAYVNQDGPQNVLRSLPSTAEDRKAAPVVSGLLDYFPLALAEVARVSKAGNDQHNPGQPLHWARHKSTDHADCIGRHLIERGTKDKDGQRHTAKVAWRALALLQSELEAEAGWTPAPEPPTESANAADEKPSAVR